MNKLKRYVCTLVILQISTFVWAASSSQADSDDAKSYLSLIASAVALIGTIVNYWSIKRKQFSGLVTSERLRFIKEWRECSAKFCELLGDCGKKKNKDKIDYYYYKMIFMCNPTKPEAYIDKELVGLLEQLYILYQELNDNTCEEKDKKKQQLKLMQKRFVALMQANIDPSSG